MLRFLLRTILTLGILLAILVGAGLYFLQDPNRFKPEIEAQIEAQTGVPVKIGGDISWKLLPPISLAVADVSARHEGADYSLATLKLDANLLSVIRTRDINQWQIDALVIDDLILRQSGDITHIHQARLTDFSPGRASPFEAKLTFTAAAPDAAGEDARASGGGDGTIPLTVKGNVAYDLDESRLSLTDTRFDTAYDTTEAAGLCDLDLVMKPGVLPPDAADAIIPLTVWRGFDWTGSCLLDRLKVDDETFRNVAVTLKNTGGNSTTALNAPEFFGGSAGITIDINAARTPVAWKIVPDLQRADSQALMGWLDQRLKWIAPLAYSGAITMTGNTEAELVNSVSGKTTFDGGKGRIDISQMKQPVLNLARMLNDTQRVEQWPDMWPYERLIGEWVVNGKTHAIDLALDNLTAKLNGDYDPLTDALDMTARVQFSTLPDIRGFDVNPLLRDLPIPVNCRGTLEVPDCAIDPKASREIVASVLAGEKGDEARAEINRQIDEKVPEEYRETARGLLDLLGGGKRKDPQE
ncbi:MAG: AsmA family protein [Pseudomonadales bacterium]|nr:AsmA family protein [Pseudomonadales bacterium]